MMKLWDHGTEDIALSRTKRTLTRVMLLKQTD